MNGYGEFNQGQFFNHKRMERELKEEIDELENKLNDGASAKRFVKNWLKKLRAAWLTKDLIKIEALFSCTSQYFETPFDQPKTNVDEVLALWKEIEEQKIVDLGFRLVALEKTRQIILAVVEWNLVLANPSESFNGIYEIKFKNQDCVYFKQWTEINN